jgi:hypothetical protein
MRNVRSTLPVAVFVSLLATLAFATQAADFGRFRGEGIVGVWMGMVPPGFRSYTPEPRWYTFFDDGQVFTDLPDQGLAGFDRAVSKASPGRGSYWGTYRFANGAGEIAQPGVNVKTVIRAVKPGEIQIDSNHFYRCADVNGVKLDGAWTSWTDPRDPALDRQPAGERPILRLTKAGRFQDEGIFKSVLASYAPGADGAGGAGSYQVKDFTLELRYDDGRVKRVAFSGFLGASPAAKDERIFLERTIFRKRK